jgi:hypothetical protein
MAVITLCQVYEAWNARVEALFELKPESLLIFEVGAPGHAPSPQHPHHEWPQCLMGPAHGHS